MIRAISDEAVSCAGYFSSFNSQSNYSILVTDNAGEPKRTDAAGSSGVNGWVAHLVPPRKVRKTEAEHRSAFLVKRNPSAMRTADGDTDTDSQSGPRWFRG
jgi:hypothetical protein